MRPEPTIDNFVTYERLGEEDGGARPVYYLWGIRTEIIDDDNTKRDGIYLWRSYNTFDDEPTIVSDGYELRPKYSDECDECLKINRYCERCEERMKKFYQNYRFGTKVLAKNYEPKKVEHPDTEVFYTHDNGGRPFKVYHDASNRVVHIYRQNQNLIYYDQWKDYDMTPMVRLAENTEVMLSYDNHPVEDEDPEPGVIVDTGDMSDTADMSENELDMEQYYDQFVCSLPYLQIWIPDGDYLTRNSDGIVVPEADKYFVGNSILVHVGNFSESNRYVSIGMEVVEFEIDDLIVEYYSLVGNSDVPYPVAVGLKYLIFMLDYVAEPRDKYSDLNTDQLRDAYSYFYGHKCISCDSNDGCGCEKTDYPHTVLTPRVIAKRDF